MCGDERQSLATRSLRIKSCQSQQKSVSVWPRTVCDCKKTCKLTEDESDAKTFSHFTLFCDFINIFCNFINAFCNKSAARI